MNSTTLVAMSLISAATLSGCAQHQVFDCPENIIQSQETTVVLTFNDTVSDIETRLFWGEILKELMIQQQQDQAQPTGQATNMPALVAGDWLAFECALAGGYWDMSKNNDAPVFAEASESWFPSD